MTASSQEKKIQRASLLMMASILLSRVIGFGREWVLAKTVGASRMTDVYSASFTIPDFLNHLMAAGALSISFVPLLASYLESDDPKFAEKAFRFVATTMGSVLFVLIIVAEIYAFQLATWVAPGFDQEQTELLTTLLRIILPAQFFFYWGGLAIAVQYAHGRFLLPALAPLIYNIGIIGFGIALHAQWGVMAFSVGVLAGCLCSHGITQWWGLRQLGYSTAPLWTATTELKSALKRYLWLTLPIMLGFSVVVADEWIAKYLASYMEAKAVSWLHFARMEMRIPVAVIGQAAGIASFPFLARLWSSQRYEEFGRTLLREIQKLWAAAPLAAIFFYIHADAITYFIFGNSLFVSEDFTNTANALRMFSLGIFFWTVQLILSRGFYACQRTWLPSLIGTAVCLAALPAYYFLAQFLGYQGLALAGSTAIALYALVLSIFLKRHLRRHCPELDFTMFLKFVFSWSVYLVIAFGMNTFIRSLGIFQYSQLSAFLEILLSLSLVVAIGLALLKTIFLRFTDGKALY